MPHCRTCGAHVSDRYHRVLSDRRGLVDCPSCADGGGRSTLKNMDGMIYEVPTP